MPFSVSSLKILINGELWFGLPKNLNDPYECEFIIKEYDNIPLTDLIEFFYETMPEFLESDSIKTRINKILSDYSIFHQDVHKYLRYRLEKFYGLTSFTYDKDNILMWSHYADSHKGFCLAFDKNELFESLRFPWKEFYDVDYKPNLITAELDITESSFEIKNEKNILCRKLDIWKKENELRLITFNFKSSKRNIAFDKKCIKGIIIGENMNSNDELTIQNIIGNDSQLSEIIIQKAVKDLGKKTMKIIKHE